LQSIINQNYKNYKVVVIDDNSDDFTFELIQKFIKESGFTDKFILLQNKVVKSAVENIYIAVH
jgi:glycosyltransferase involved in cell wall biosynthesis